ncbi:c-type cytochrome [Acidisphaera rubrifaciens]|uniref:Cytochrome c n=1 Tax=Acidisphaera rubrifaciens HS-AP3 TaxID=1231350 RepID=A0A0D6P6R2_9PROT|nr:c-type cytochrome [Acidisphaera rubrifaciens]GAN77031.1 cytochrome c [Acidisphaera rubrifaciens HS-AP3]
MRRLCFPAALLLPAAILLGAAEVVRNPYEGNVAAAAAGHKLFNETCAHCHGPDAVTGLPERNLRHLRLRYGDDMAQVFHTTVENGRPDKGMPTWGGALPETTIWKIYTWLETVQASDD